MYARQKLHKYIHFLDIPSLVKYFIDHSYLIVLGMVFKQFRGAPIGSQTAPAICNYTVAFEEYVWQATYEVTKRSNVLATRYVDNRLLLLFEEIADTEPFRRLTNLMF